MRYLKPAAFLMLMVGSSMPLLSQVAIAAPAEAPPEGLDPESGSVPDADQSSRSQPLAQADGATSSVNLAAILDGARGHSDKALLYAQLASFEEAAPPPIVSAVRSPQLTRRLTSFQPVAWDVTPNAAPEVNSGVDVMDTSALQPLPEPSPQLAQQPAGTKVLTLEALRRWVEAAPQSDTPSEADAVAVPVQTVPAQSAAADAPQDLAQASPAQDAPVQDAPVQETPAAAEGDLPTLVNPAPEDSDSTETPAVDAPPMPPAESQPVDASEESGESGAENGAEISELPDILFADPNPLNVPVLPEEVELDKTPVITLDQAVELAYRNNQALQSALLTLEQAEAVVREANAARLPTVSVVSDLSARLSDGDTRSDLGADLRVDYNLLTGGSRGASIRAAELQREVSALAVEAQQEQIRLTTANAYYALQEAGEQIRIQQAFVNEAERNLRDARLRQEVGVGTRFDVLRAEVQFANAQQSSIQSQSDQQVASRDIARLLNLPPTSGIQSTPVAVAENWPLTLEDSIVLATQNRAELEQQLLQADISEEQRKIALAAIRPQLSLFANFGVDSVLSGGDAFTDDFQEASTVGARFSMSLFDGGTARAQARQRALDGEIAEQQFSENADQIRFDVEQAFFNLDANKKNIATSEIAVAQAQEALELANLRLQAGVGTQLDVLTAQSELTQAESNNVTAILSYNRALAAMQRAVSNLGLFAQ
ncbi:MAG: TolC family protein [Cyanobacteria bacterium J06598_1]